MLQGTEQTLSRLWTSLYRSTQLTHLRRKCKYVHYYKSFEIGRCAAQCNCTAAIKGEEKKLFKLPEILLPHLDCLPETKRNTIKLQTTDTKQET